jgi:hypothetical protein
MLDIFFVLEVPHVSEEAGCLCSPALRRWAHPVVFWSEEAALFSARN